MVLAAIASSCSLSPSPPPLPAYWHHKCSTSLKCMYLCLPARAFRQGRALTKTYKERRPTLLHEHSPGPGASSSGLALTLHTALSLSLPPPSSELIGGQNELSPPLIRARKRTSEIDFRAGASYRAICSSRILARPAGSSPGSEQDTHAHIQAVLASLLN